MGRMLEGLWDLLELAELVGSAVGFGYLMGQNIVRSFSCLVHLLGI
jgi:hypothetical protein